MQSQLQFWPQSILGTCIPWHHWNFKILLQSWFLTSVLGTHYVKLSRLDKYKGSFGFPFGLRSSPAFTALTTITVHYASPYCSFLWFNTLLKFYVYFTESHCLQRNTYVRWNTAQLYQPIEQITHCGGIVHLSIPVPIPLTSSPTLLLLPLACKNPVRLLPSICSRKLL